jgi:predicted metal-dependent enzyme (double-stranded beta helix superfamily)
MEQTGRDELRLSRRDVLVGISGLLAAQACQAPAKANRSSEPPPQLDARMAEFVAHCVAANHGDRAQDNVKEVLARRVSDPRATLQAIGEPTKAGLTVFHRSKTLTIFAATWTPQMNLMPHNHRMWALIGIYTGREDNILWRPSGKRLSAYDAKALFEGDVAALPDTAIHSVTNPLERFTGGIHVYGGDFFATARSQWNPETLAEEPSDGEVIRAIFERANARYERS